jgi:hypothetical protein
MPLPPRPRATSQEPLFTLLQLPGLEQTRTCGKCRLALPLTSFNRHPSNGYQWWCRDCFRDYFRERGQLHRDQSERAKRRRRDEAKVFLAKYLAKHPCIDCGQSDIVVLEFDHVGEKRGHVSWLAAQGLSIRGLKAEIKCCEAVCANCHRRRTASRGRWYRAGFPLSSLTMLPGERTKLEFVLDLLRRSCCVDCGEEDLCVLDFDHVEEKTGSVLRFAREGYAWAKLKAEIAKCVIRCANCHRRRTAIALGHYRARA